jgi:hypothetical protein
MSNIDAINAAVSRRAVQRERLARILGQHVRDMDRDVSDKDFVLRVFGRWARELDTLIIDINE